MNKPRKLRPGSVFVHYKNGKAYQVLHVEVKLAGTLDDILPNSQSQVVYRSLDDGRVYVRTTEDFMEVFPNGLSRFKELDLTYLPPKGTDL